MSTHAPHHLGLTARIAGPWGWLGAALVGVILGALLARVLPAPEAEGHQAIPLWLASPFAVLLLAMSLMPFLGPKFWHHFYPHVALILGGLVASYLVTALGGPSGEGPHMVAHAAVEYYAFIALVGGLFIVSGGILIDIQGRGTPFRNTVLLGIGAVLANLVGTTGASMLLIRPYLRINEGRLRPLHVVMFIFIVSNCGGLLTPVGDPPLYLGYLAGVPFFWTLANLWPDWLFVVILLLAIFFVLDTLIGRGQPGAEPGQGMRIRVRGSVGIAGLGLIVAGIFLDPLLMRLTGAKVVGAGATLQILTAAAVYVLTPRELYERNGFLFEPIKEVSLLFAGIFLTMAPALVYVAAHGEALGLNSPGRFYFATGALSAMLDNAPTYINMLQTARGQEPLAVFLAASHGPATLAAISTGAVFFGAMTYIGNGPNLMVKAIAQTAQVRMPSFLGYALRAAVILLPVLMLHWWFFVR